MRFRRGAVALAAAVVLVGACTVEDEGASDESEASNPSGDAQADAAGVTEGGEWDASSITETAADLECGLEAPDPDRGITDDSIRVGGLLTASGPTTAVFGDAAEGARVRLRRTNDEGGVHGRQIDYVGTEDDGLDSARQVDGARSLVNDDVFAVMPLMSALPSWRDTFCEAVMPTFGWGFTPAWCDSTVAFPITGCISDPEPDYRGFGLGSIFDLTGDGNTMALLGTDEEAARLGIELLTDAFTAHDIDVVYAENPLSPTTPVADPSPIVNDIMTSNDGGPPDFVYQVLDFANTSTMTQALTAAGYEGHVLNAVGYDPRLAEFEAFEGSYTTLQWMPFEATEVEFVEQMNEDFEQYAPELSRGLPAAAGYIAADMLIAGLEATGPDLTVDSFLETLNDDWVYSTPGFRGDAQFPQNHVAQIPCGTLVELDGGQFSATSPIVCTDPEPME